MKVCVHVMFKGDCEAAFATYQRVLGGTLLFSMRFSESPAAAEAPPDWQEKIWHATMTIGDLTIQGADPLFPDYQPLTGFSLVASVADRDEAERVFAGLADGGVEVMPVQETAWSAAFGVVTDRFGVPWEINCEQMPQSA